MKDDHKTAPCFPEGHSHRYGRTLHLAYTAVRHSRCIFGKNPLEVLKYYGPAYLTAVGTMSSAATPAVALEGARKSKVLRKDNGELRYSAICQYPSVRLCPDRGVLCHDSVKILYGELPSVGMMVLFCMLLAYSPSEHRVCRAVRLWRPWD